MNFTLRFIHEGKKIYFHKTEKQVISFLCRFIHCFGHKAKQESLYLYDCCESLSAGIVQLLVYNPLLFTHCFFFFFLIYFSDRLSPSVRGAAGGEWSPPWRDI